MYQSAFLAREKVLNFACWLSDFESTTLKMKDSKNMKHHYISVANFILRCTSNWIWLQFRMICAHFRPWEEKNSLKKYYSLDRTETNDFVTRAHRALFWLSLRPGHFLTISTSSWYLRGTALNSNEFFNRNRKQKQQQTDKQTKKTKQNANRKHKKNWKTHTHTQKIQ